MTADATPPQFPSLTFWSVEMPAQPASSPVVAGEVVAAALQSGAVSAWKLATGQQAWTVKLAVTGPMTSTGDRFVVQVDDTVHALAAASGKVLWTIEAGSIRAPLVARGGWVFVASGEELTALRLSDGAKVWSQKTGPVDRRPAIDGDRLYVPVTDGRLVALDLLSGSVLWERQLGANPSEPLAFGDRVYLGAGRDFWCLKVQTGVEDWHWSTIGALIVGAPAADASHVYFAAMDNLVRAMDRISGNRRWKADLGHRPEAGPTVVGSIVAVPGRAAAIRGFDAATGRPVVQLTLPDPMVVQPTFFITAGGRQMVAALTANLTGASRLTVAGSVLPFLPVAPLTTLPGAALKLPLGELKPPPL
jgi:outer membrane protein assembly factor BamB